MQYERDYNGKSNRNIIYYWRKEVYVPSMAQELANGYSDEKLVSCSFAVYSCSMSLYNKTMTWYEGFFYDEQGNLLKHAEFYDTPQTIVPNTYDEHVFYDVYFYARDNIM